MASNSAKQHIKKVLAAARRAGWRIENRGGHWRLYPTDKNKPPMTMAQSPSKYTNRMLKDARTRGLDV